MIKEFKYLPIALLLITALALANDKLYYVTNVLDGDTLQLSNREKIRLIGIDTPEFHYSYKLIRDARRRGKDAVTIQEMGKKAADFTRRLCRGKKVRLEFDVQKRDRYGRILAYVYLEDGAFVNAKIVKEGYGQVMTVTPNVKYAEFFLKLEQDARAKHKGLWGEES